MDEDKRLYGLDLLKILSMLGVLSLHILGSGGILKAENISAIQYHTAWFMEICAMSSVNIFALISGYLSGEKTKLNSWRAFELFSSAQYYSLIFTVFVLAIGVTDMGIKTYLNFFIPFLPNSYWYMNCYLFILIISPFINRFTASLNRKQINLFLGISIVMLGLIPSFFNYDVYRTNSGYSIIWLTVCYITGAQVRQRQYKKMPSYIYLILFAGCALILTGGNILGKRILGRYPSYMLEYSSPFIFFMSLCMLQMFSNVKGKKLSPRLKKLIVTVTEASFDVYIIHCHPIIIDYFFRNHFLWMLKFNPFLFSLILAGTIIALFILFDIMGIIRIKIFRLIRLNKLFMKITKDRLSYSIE